MVQEWFEEHNNQFEVFKFKFKFKTTLFVPKGQFNSTVPKPYNVHTLSHTSIAALVSMRPHGDTKEVHSNKY